MSKNKEKSETMKTHKKGSSRDLIIGIIVGLLVIGGVIVIFLMKGSNKCTGVNCSHGSCDKKTGKCVCNTGWTGKDCNVENFYSNYK